VRIKGHERRRAAVLGVVGVAFVGLAIVVVSDDLAGSDMVASVVSAFTGLAALAAAVLALNRSPRSSLGAAELAQDLAETLRGEWLDEARARGLRDAKVLPLSWSTGRMDGRFDDAAARLADGYRSIASGRLVVLGEPGSGKSVLAILLTLGLLADREPDEPVPVLLAASSWDPVRDPFDEWIVHSVATGYYNGRDDVVRTLLANGLVLPVVDGLDEVPEDARRHAVRRINAAVGADRPVVLTCRSVEYDDLIDAGAPALRKAPVQRVRPVAVEDVVGYLSSVGDWPAGTSWSAVYEALRRAPDGPVAAALSTPLMVSLAHTTYQRGGGDPGELLDVARFPSRLAVEDHLVDRAIDTAYAPGPASTAPDRWDAVTARRWLVFLARYLHDRRERGLVWWRLADHVVSPWVAPMLGIVLGLAVLAIGFLSLVGLLGQQPVHAFGAGALGGVVVASLATVLWYGTAGRAPGRMALVRRGSADRLRRGLQVGAAFVAVPGLPSVLGLGVVVAFDRGSFSDVTVFAVYTALVVGLAVVVGTAVAVHHWLDAIPERPLRADPIAFLRQDRLASVVSALAAGVVAGLLSPPITLAAVFTGQVLGRGLAGWVGESGDGDLSGVVKSVTAPTGIALLITVSMLVVAVLVFMSRAWARFVVARTVLAVRGQLPWKLLAFLADARSRGLLRQSGGTYQFRHVRIQERLATPVEASAPPARERRRRRAVPVGLAVVLGATAVVTLTTANHLRCEPVLHLGTDFDRVRVYDDGVQSCIGVLAPSDLDRLAASEEAVARLREGNERAEDEPGATTIALALPLGVGTSLTPAARSVAEGVALAQRERARLGPPTVVRLVNSGTDDRHLGTALDRLRAIGQRPGRHFRATVTTFTDRTDRGEPVPDPRFDRFPVGLRRESVLFFPRNDAFAETALRRSTMHEHIRNALNVRWLDELPLPGEQVSDEPSALLYPRWSASDGRPYVEDLCCLGSTVFVTLDEAVPDELRSRDARKFPGLTLYYPTRTPSAARDYADVVSQAGFDGYDALSEAAYRAALNAAGTSDYTINQLTATPGGWVKGEAGRR
jgi:hypothetical protein